MEWKNKLFFGDNLPILRNEIESESVDLVYLDPPFNSKATYNVLYAEKSGEKSTAQITAFEDTWHWGVEAESAFRETVVAGGKLAELLQAFRDFLGQNDMMAYLSMMAPRLRELHRVLKSTGSLYLHCDPTASHYLKVLLDSIFGPTNFKNEIAWKRTTAHNDPQRFGRIGDRILFYAKTNQKTFRRLEGSFSAQQLKRYKHDEGGEYRAENLTAPHFSETRTVEWRGVHPGQNRQWRFSIEELERLYEEGKILLKKNGTPRKDGLKEYLSEAESPALQDIWTDIALPPTTSERLGYPTQKPEALLERIILSSSNEGDVVLDPFCGCGTAVAVAERLKRKWIGIDLTHLAITLIKHRLAHTFKGEPPAAYEVFGEPTDLEGAKALAKESRYKFETWAIGLVEAKPAQDKKGADSGLDGIIRFFDDKSGKAKKAVVQVKSGHVSAPQIRDLARVREREKAEIAVFVTLAEPTGPMKNEAVVCGFYQPDPVSADKVSRIQILTIRELLKGEKVKLPRGGMVETFKKAEKKSRKAQQNLFG